MSIKYVLWRSISIPIAVKLYSSSQMNVTWTMYEYQILWLLWRFNYVLLSCRVWLRWNIVTHSLTHSVCIFLPSLLNSACLYRNLNCSRSLWIETWYDEREHVVWKSQGGAKIYEMLCNITFNYNLTWQSLANLAKQQKNSSILIVIRWPLLKQ